MRAKKLDTSKILAKLDEMDSYIEEIEKIRPVDFDEYTQSIEKKRAIERLLQITVETVIDISYIIISNLKLGIPSNEDALFDKLKENKIISPRTADTLNDMKGFRNILVHKYGKVESEKVFENLEHLHDFETFKEEILQLLKKRKHTK